MNKKELASYIREKKEKIAKAEEALKERGKGEIITRLSAEVKKEVDEEIRLAMEEGSSERDAYENLFLNGCGNLASDLAYNAMPDSDDGEEILDAAFSFLSAKARLLALNGLAEAIKKSQQN